MAHLHHQIQALLIILDSVRRALDDFPPQFPLDGIRLGRTKVVFVKRPSPYGQVVTSLVNVLRRGKKTLNSLRVYLKLQLKSQL